MDNTIPLWIAEFGSGYAVPTSITNEPGLTDVSWHNDICPSFMWADLPSSATLPGDEVLDFRLWVEHVDQGMREADGQRFVISTQHEEIASTDDADEAMKIFRACRRLLLECGLVVKS